MMRWIRALLSALAALYLLAGAAQAAIGTPVQLGTAVTTTSMTTVTVTTTATAPAGDMILVVIGQGSSGTANVQDSAGNSYTELGIINHANNTSRMRLFLCANPVALASGGTITFLTSVGARLQISAISVSGMASAPFDQITAGLAVASDPSPSSPTSPATGALAQADELLVGVALINSGGGDTFTQPSGWTGLTAITGGAGETAIRWGYKVVSSTAAQTYGPATNAAAGGAARTWLAGAAAFKAGSVSAPASKRTMMLGVGDE